MVTRLIRMPQLKSVAEVLAHLAHGGPEWTSRFVTMMFNGQPDAWVTLCSIRDENSPYFDFAYNDKASPQEAFAEILAYHSECEVIDWSPGRLACIQANGANVAKLNEIITAVAKAAFGMNQLTVEAFYEDMQRA